MEICEENLKKVLDKSGNESADKELCSMIVKVLRNKDISAANINAGNNYQEDDSEDSNEVCVPSLFGDDDEY